MKDARTYKVNSEVRRGEVAPWTYEHDGKVWLPRLPKPRDWHLRIHPCSGCQAPHAWGRVYCPVLTKIINSQRCHRLQAKNGVAARAYVAAILQERRQARRAKAAQAHTQKRLTPDAGSDGSATSGKPSAGGSGKASASATTKPARRESGVESSR